MPSEVHLTRMKIGLVSLGCPKNLVDSEVMLGLAQKAGHELTREPEQADVLVVNTCAFIDKAKQESIDAILEMAQHKKDGSCQRLVVTGCMGERYRDELLKEIPEIDAVQLVEIGVMREGVVVEKIRACLERMLTRAIADVIHEFVQVITPASRRTR